MKDWVKFCYISFYKNNHSFDEYVKREYWAEYRFSDHVIMGMRNNEDALTFDGKSIIDEIRKYMISDWDWKHKR